MHQGAVEHARAVGREAIRAGVHPNQIREIFHEYEAQLENSVTGTFTHLLLARGAITPELYDRINSTIPSDLDDSQAAIETHPLPAHTSTATGPVPPDSGFDSTRTMGFGAVLGPGGKPKPGSAAPAASPELTMAYEDVIDLPTPGEESAQVGGAGWGSTVMRAPGAVPESRRSGVVGLGQLQPPEPGPAGSGLIALPGAGSGRYAAPSPTSSGRYPNPTRPGAASGAPPAPGAASASYPVPGAPPRVPGIGTPVPGGASGNYVSPAQPPSDVKQVSAKSTAADSRSQGLANSSASKSKSGSGPLGPPNFGSNSNSELDLISDNHADRDAEFFEEPEDDGEEGEEWSLERAPEPGDVFGNFRLVREIGRGGMGVIYEAQKIGTEDSFALKTLHVGNSGGSSKRRIRFQREVEALRRLTHPNIVAVHDFGRKGPYDFYAMDYIVGRELKEAINNDDMSPREKLDVFVQICEGVAHAHERNVIHRDLKPANVLLNADNTAFVLDFGLAKLSDESLELTKTGAALGTPYYMAPEQIKSPKDVDTRVDVFALGVILYELMTGVRPFQGQTAGEVTHKIINTDPPKPTSLNEKLRPALDAIVFKAIEKDAEVRYQTVDELRREVAKYRRGDRVRDAGDVAQFKATIRRYWAANMAPLLIGFFVASMVYLPWIYLLLS
ncbi:MAG: protein kinase [Planctomycetes bacterium]|nr:protein kinase [Planctomycetota bacterium]